MWQSPVSPVFSPICLDLCVMGLWGLWYKCLCVMHDKWHLPEIAPLPNIQTITVFSARCLAAPVCARPSVSPQHLHAGGPGLGLLYPWSLLKLQRPPLWLCIPNSLPPVWTVLLTFRLGSQGTRASLTSETKPLLACLDPLIPSPPHLGGQQSCFPRQKSCHHSDSLLSLCLPIYQYIPIAPPPEYQSVTTAHDRHPSHPGSSHNHQLGHTVAKPPCGASKHLLLPRPTSRLCDTTPLLRPSERPLPSRRTEPESAQPPGRPLPSPLLIHCSHTSRALTSRPRLGGAPLPGIIPFQMFKKSALHSQAPPCTKVSGSRRPFPEHFL